jgi:hypothetical protein
MREWHSSGNFAGNQSAALPPRYITVASRRLVFIDHHYGKNKVKF